MFSNKINKNFERGVFLLSKIRIKNSVGADMHVGKLLIYFGDQIEDIATTILERNSG